MKNLVEIDKSNISDFLENFVDSGVKILDEMNLFDKDELLAAIPYGKIVGYVSKKFIEIDNPNEALKRSIALAHAVNLLNGIKRSNIVIKIDIQEFKEKLKTVKKELINYQTNFEEFDLDNFHQNNIVNTYTEKIKLIFSIYFNEFQTNRVDKYRFDFLKQDFLKILDTHNNTYGKLIKALNTKSFKEGIEIKYKNEYQEELKNLFNDLALNDTAGMTLADIYIEPNFRVHDYCLVNPNGDEYSSYQNKGFKNLTDESIHEFIYKGINSKLADSRLINNSPNLFFILGYPGQGKSSFCKKILYDIYETDFTEKDVFFIKIRNITDTIGLLNNPLQTLFDSWASENNNTTKLKIDKSSIYSSLLILDGLDELFMKENLQERAIDEFCRIMLRETEQRPNLKVIITSRYGYISFNTLKQSNSLIIQLKEFNEAQQLQWLDKYSYFHPETNLTKKKIETYNNDNNYLPIKELITQPILLHLIATLNQDLTSDMNRATIYGNLFTELIQRSWAKEGQIDNLKGLTKDDLREFLREIAYEIFQSGREYIHKSSLIKLPTTQSFINKLDNKDKVQDILKNIMIAFYFQETKKEKGDLGEEERNDYAIEFLHKSLQEYLVAEKIWENLQELINKDVRRNRYFIESASRGLDIINNLFSIKMLPNEIITNLNEIINNSDENIRLELSDRIKSFLPTWLQFGLINNFIWKEDIFHLKESAIYHNFFQVLTSLVSGRNYFTEDVNVSMLSNKDIQISLKDQIITGSYENKNVVTEDVNEFEVNIYNSKFNIVDTKSSNKQRSDFAFRSITLQSINFFQIHSQSQGSFYNSIISGCEFISLRTRIGRFDTICDMKFDQCSFRNVGFYEGIFESNNCYFYRCTFYIFNKHSFRKCVFEECVFYIRKNTNNNILKGNRLKNCAKIKVKNENIPTEEMSNIREEGVNVVEL